MFRAPDWLNVFLHWAHLCGFSPLWVSICIFRFPASLIELLHCVHLYSFTTYYVKLETLPDSLKNLGASYWVISEKRSVWESLERLRNVYSQKNNTAHLQNRDALCSQPCTFVIGPGSGCWGYDHSTEEEKSASPCSTHSKTRDFIKKRDKLNRDELVLEWFLLLQWSDHSLSRRWS